MKNIKLLIIFLLFSFGLNAQNVDLSNGSNYIRIQRNGEADYSRAFGLNSSNELYIGSVEKQISSMYFYNKDVGYLMTLSPIGNVGIGITNPKGKFQISGTSEASSSSALNGQLILSSSSTGLVNTFGIDASSSNAYSWIQSGHNSNSSTFDLALNPRGGSVGIGTTNPTGNLQINGLSEASSSTTLNGHLILSSNATGLVNTFGIHTSSTNPYSWIQSGHNSNSNTFDLALNPRGGNVGIGTASPLTKLHILDEGAGGPAAGTVPHQGILIGGKSTGGVLNMGINANGGFYSWLQSRHKDHATWFNLALNPEGGKVGVGTAAPQRKLHISDESMVQLRLERPNTSTGFSDIGGANGDLYFYPGGYSLKNGNVFFHTTGNVGIGTTDSKGYKLAVAGKLISEEVVVKLQPWPDYVFEADYPLTPLQDLEIYLKENKHLPNIPTAKEAAEEGIKLGEMNAKLLEKVEELTLYIIQMEKRIKELEKVQK